MRITHNHFLKADPDVWLGRSSECKEARKGQFRQEDTIRKDFRRTEKERVVNGETVCVVVGWMCHCFSLFLSRCKRCSNNLWGSNRANCRCVQASRAVSSPEQQLTRTKRADKKGANEPICQKRREKPTTEKTITAAVAAASLSRVKVGGNTIGPLQPTSNPLLIIIIGAIFLRLFF